MIIFKVKIIYFSFFFLNYIVNKYYTAIKNKNTKFTLYLTSKKTFKKKLYKHFICLIKNIIKKNMFANHTKLLMIEKLKYRGFPSE